MKSELEQNSVQLSIVTPVYWAQDIVKEFVLRVSEVAQATNMSYEIVMVEDGSADQSWLAVSEECRKDPRVKGIRLSRNFGQHQAITAGLQVARGKFVVVMDCDLQENPKYIPELLERARAGADIVFTRKSSREFSFFRNFITGPFYLIFNYLVADPQMTAHKNQGTFSLLTRKVVEAFLSVRDQHRHYLTIVRWLGFKSDQIEIVHERRFKGKSSYTFRKLVIHALNGITSQSNRLLHLSVKMGISFCILAFCGVIYLIVMYFISGFKEGWASLAVLLLFCTGMILMMLGIQGIYLGNVFDQVRDRPLYLVSEKINF